MTSWRFFFPTTLFYGDGAVRELAAHIKARGLVRGLLLADPYFHNSGVAASLQEIFAEQKITLPVFADIAPNARLSDITRASEAFTLNRCGFVIALGGGSTMDSAKAVAVLSSNPGPYTRYEGDDLFTRQPCPIYVIPTTAGTGSEVSGSAVVCDDACGGAKHSVRGAMQIPQAAALVPRLLATLPRHIIAQAGVDTLTHAVESYISRWATPVTSMFSLEALRLTCRHLKALYEDANKREAAGGMLLASMMAGVGFLGARVGLAHAVGTHLETLCHLPHAAALGLLLPESIRFQSPWCLDKTARIARCMLEEGAAAEPHGAVAAEDAPELLRRFIKGLGMEACLPRGAVSEEEAEEIGKKALFSVHTGASPANPTAEDLKDILLASIAR